MKNYKKILPSLQELELVSKEIKNVPNKKGEYLRKIHYGCYLLCSESGLRISEAVKFDLNAKTRKGLYRITKTKGKKERYVYISPEVVKELKKKNHPNHHQRKISPKLPKNMNLLLETNRQLPLKNQFSRNEVLITLISCLIIHY